MGGYEGGRETERSRKVYGHIQSQKARLDNFSIYQTIYLYMDMEIWTRLFLVYRGRADLGDVEGYGSSVQGALAEEHFWSRWTYIDWKFRSRKDD